MRTVTSVGAGLSLRPERDVDTHDGRCVATSPEPWLSLEVPDATALADRFVEIVFRGSFWDCPTRPVFRFWRDDGSWVDRIAAGPVVGAGIWCGRVPAKLARISVSPTNEIGRFDFRVESLRTRSWLGLLARGLRQNPGPAAVAVLARLLGWRPESDGNLEWATAFTPMRSYDVWRAQRAREVEPDGLDQRRFDWATAAPLNVVVIAGDTSKLRETLDSLVAQAFDGWKAFVPCQTDHGRPSDPRIVVGSSAEADALATAGGAMTCVVQAGDRLTPAALACVAEQAHRHPLSRLLYGDAVLTLPGRPATPVFQPGWSPRLFAGSRTLAAPIFVRDIAHWPRDEALAFIRSGQLPTAIFTSLAPGEARPLHRALLDRRTNRCRAPAPPPATPAAPAAITSLIIPTRDHPALLRRLVDSIRTHTRPGCFEIVLADHASETDAAKALLTELARAPDVVRSDFAGPFNFSAICNRAAAAANGDVLVFLNDDTQVLSPGWLDRLAAHALAADVGAVGAKLTYRDGRVQHLGIRVGMGESSGHFGIASGDAAFDGRGSVPYEVSAVTGACLAVARDKFQAVGGFDEVHLPVECGDVDLCLKLNARGWQTIVDPSVHLMHEESASRGRATFRRLSLYADQRAVFTTRWRHVLRDDPFFHPGLSLFSTGTALG